MMSKLVTPVATDLVSQPTLGLGRTVMRSDSFNRQDNNNHKCCASSQQTVTYYPDLNRAEPDPYPAKSNLPGTQAQPATPAKESTCSNRDPGTTPRGVLWMHAREDSAKMHRHACFWAVRRWRCAHPKNSQCGCQSACCSSACGTCCLTYKQAAAMQPATDKTACNPRHVTLQAHPPPHRCYACSSMTA